MMDLNSSSSSKAAALLLCVACNQSAQAVVAVFAPSQMLTEEPGIVRIPLIGLQAAPTVPNAVYRATNSGLVEQCDPFVTLSRVPPKTGLGPRVSRNTG